MKVGDSGATRTHDPQLRRLLLYPTELRNRRFFLFAAANIEAVLISPRLASGLWLGDRIKTAPSQAFCSSTKRGVRRKNRVSSFYGSHAMARTFLEMLATVLQTPKHFPWDLRGSRKRQKVFRGTCGAPANAKKFFVGLATVLQTPKSFSWDLQRCCKRQKVFRGTCNGVANARKFFVGLATVLQTPESFS